MSTLNPGQSRASCLLGNFKLHGPLRLLLYHDGLRKYSTTVGHVADENTKQIAAAKLAVDYQIEQSQIAGRILQLQPDAYGQDFLQFQGRFLADELAFVPWPNRSGLSLVGILDPLLLQMKGDLFCSSCYRRSSTYTSL